MPTPSTGSTRPPFLSSASGPTSTLRRCSHTCC